jgi:hypothetical protein
MALLGPKAARPLSGRSYQQAAVPLPAPSRTFPVVPDAESQPGMRIRNLTLGKTIFYASSRNGFAKDFFNSIRQERTFAVCANE